MIRVRRSLIAAVAAGGLLAVTPLASSGAGASQPPRLTNFHHVFVIMMENLSRADVVGNPNAPFINHLVSSAGDAQSYFGLAHPSQPNYIGITSGSTQGVTSDSTVTLNARNIVDQIEASGRTWKAYEQSIFADGNTSKLADSAGNQLYERKHNPFVSYLDVQNNPARMARVVDLSQLGTDMATQNGLPNYVWIGPDQCNDMHGRAADASDPCSFSNEQALISAGDAFVKTEVNQIEASRAWANDSSNDAIFITWDESSFPETDTGGCCDAVPGGGQVAGVVVLSRPVGHRVSTVPYNNYSVLATIEDAWGLGCLNFTCDTANVKPMTDLAGSGS